MMVYLGVVAVAAADCGYPEFRGLAHFGDALQHFVRRQKIKPTELIIRPEITPRRAPPDAVSTGLAKH
jgi:hypothetical protein